MKKTIYLIDISSFVFRAYYGIRPLHSSKGVPTHATYGVVTMLLKLIREKNPDYLVIVFDSPVPSFRKEIYNDYKANREAPPEDLPVQFEHVKKFVTTYPLPHLQCDGFEADDLIATLISKLKSGQAHLDGARPEETEIVIVTGDKDLMQLVAEGVAIYDPMKDKAIGPAEVKEKFGVGPHQVADVLALSGDASDNIPGVKGIGEKTATKLISQWGSLENLLANVDQVAGKVGENLRNHLQDARLSRQLVSLHEDVPLEPDWKCFSLPQPKQNELNAFFRDLELKTLVVDTAEPTVTLEEKTPRKYDLVLTSEDLKRWVGRLQKSSRGFSFDTETTGLDPFTAALVGLSFSDRYGQACYIPVSHVYLGCPPQLPKEEVLAALKPLLEDPSLPKFAQNAKFDMEVLSREGICVRGVAGDTLVAAYLANPEGQHNLDHLSSEYLKVKTILFTDIVKKGQTFDQVELETACQYSAEDADMTMGLVEPLHGLLQNEGLWTCYEEIELPLIETLFRMESRGVLVDVPYLNQLEGEFGGRIRKLEEEIYRHAGTTFNVQSPKQLAEILFVKLGLPPQRKTKTGYSTDVDVLLALSKLHPMPKSLLEHRMLCKLKSTYVDQLKNLVNPATGRIHTSYNQTVTATGRLSSSDPNLQNIPIRSEDGRRIREAFRAEEGWKILSADYSQIELRLLAAFSQDPNLVQAFADGSDVHALTAQKVFGLPPDQITPALRSMAKTVNFGILYGQSPFGLSKILEISQGEAKKYIDEFYNQFPSVRDYKEKVLEEVRRKGEVRTWQGRRRLVPEINSRNTGLKNAAERTAFNTIFQGAAADLIKIAMNRIDRALIDGNYKTRMVMQVHDELVFEVPEDELEAVKKVVWHEMETAVECSVPLRVDVGVGENWAKAH